MTAPLLGYDHARHCRNKDRETRAGSYPALPVTAQLQLRVTGCNGQLELVIAICNNKR